MAMEHKLKIDTPSQSELLRQLAIIFLSAILIIFVMPTTMFIVLPASVLLRLVAKLMAAVFRPELSQIFCGKGVMFAREPIYTRPKTNVVSHMFFSSSGPIPLEQLRLQFEQRVLQYTDDNGTHPYEKLTQTWTNFMGFIFWKRDEDFNLGNHIRLYDYTDPKLALPAKCTEDDLKRITGKLLARPWVKGRSPWEFLIVPDHSTTEEPGRKGFMAIFRYHHAMADGYSLLRMLLRFTGSSTVKLVTPTFPKLSPFQQLTRPLVVLLKLPYDIAEFFVNSFDGPNCWHFLWKKLSRKYHVFFSDDIDVEIMKKIKRRYRLDYNSTVFSITCGSIRRLMLDVGQELPKSLSLVVPFPLPNQPEGLALHMSATLFKFDPRLASAKDRIRQVAASLNLMQKLSTSPISFCWLADMLALFPTCISGLVYDNLMTTISMTSLPGPDVIPVVGDTNLTGFRYAVGLTFSKLGAVASIVTMAGTQRITLVVDQAIFQGYKVPTNFAQFVNQEIEHLLR